jgi:putative aldouronate transport system permease protein
MASISNPRMLMNNSGLIMKPQGNLTFDGYLLVFNNKQILDGYINTLIYVGATTILGTILTLIAGFVLSRKTEFKTFLTLLIIFTMIFNGGLIPTFMVIRGLGLIDTRWAIIIPGVINAFYIIIMKNSFEQLPDSFEESAKLDGAGPLTSQVQKVGVNCLPVSA